MIGRDFATKLDVDYDTIEYNRMTYNEGNDEFLENKILEMSDIINEKRKKN